MILDAVPPFAAQLPILGAADEGCVLARHARLITIAVQGPRLHLAFAEFAAVQQVMKRMLVVVLRGTDGAQSRLQLVGAHDAAARFCTTI